MNTRKNGPLTLELREQMVRAILDQGLDEAEIARKFRTTRTTVRKWVTRFSAEGVEGLTDRSFLKNPPRALRRWQLIKPYLDKRQQLLWAAVEADVIGVNGSALRFSSSAISKRVSEAHNPVEYRLFSQISMNWAGKPLRDLDTMLAYIWGTTTTTGLMVEAHLDQEIYRKRPKGK